MPESHIISFQPEDTDEAAGVLSSAMCTNPIHVAVYMGAGKRQRKVQEEGFARMLRDSPHEVYLVKSVNRIVGVMRMYSCEGQRELPVGFEDLVEAGEDSLQDVASRQIYWRGVWIKHDPVKPHSHLGPIAVLPELQGQGIGSSMMNHYCRLVDNRGVPAHLETDRVGNVRFYQQFGFKLVEEVEIFGVRNFFMWREPS